MVRPPYEGGHAPDRTLGLVAKAVSIAGFTLVIAGLVLLVLPGPGLLLIIAGLAILATEYVWAQRALNFAKQKAEQAKNKVLGKKAHSDAAEGPVRPTDAEAP